MRTAKPFVTCVRIPLFGPSAISEPISIPRFIGPGCITNTSFLHRRNRSCVKPKNFVNSRTEGNWLRRDALKLHAQHVHHVHFPDDGIKIIHAPRPRDSKDLGKSVGGPTRITSAPIFDNPHKFDRATRLLAISPTIATFNPAIFPNRSRIV